MAPGIDSELLYNFFSGFATLTSPSTDFDFPVAQISFRVRSQQPFINLFLFWVQSPWIISYVVCLSLGVLIPSTNGNRPCSFLLFLFHLLPTTTDEMPRLSGMLMTNSQRQVTMSTGLMMLYHWDSEILTLWFTQEGNRLRRGCFVLRWKSSTSIVISQRKPLIWVGDCQQKESKARRQKSPKYLIRMISFNTQRILIGHKV